MANKLKKSKILGIVAVGFVVWVAGVYGGYLIYYTNERQLIKKPEITVIEPKTKEIASIDKPVIDKSTKIVYEYCYSDDGYVETMEDTPPYFLLNLTREEVEDKLKDWQIKKFSDSEVVLQKNIEGKGRENYIIGEYEGLVAVFYEEEVDGEHIMEITETPVNSLPEEEQIKIKNGVKVKGQNELIKCMENYES